MTPTHNGHDPNSPTCSVPSCSFANSLDPTTSWRDDHFQCSKMFKWLNVVSMGLQQASHAWLALISRNNTCTSNHLNAYAATWQWISLDLGRCKSVKFSTTSHKCLCMCAVAWLMMDNVRRRSESKGSKLSCKVSSDAPLHTLTFICIYIYIYFDNSNL